MIIVWIILALVVVPVAVVLLKTLMLKPRAAANATIELDESERAVLYGPLFTGFRIHIFPCVPVLCDPRGISNQCTFILIDPIGHPFSFNAQFA